MKFSSFTVAAVAALIHNVAAFGKLPSPPPVAAAVGAVTGTAYFDQLIDHKNPSLGTFKQKYFWSDQWYNGTGSPVCYR